MVQDYEILSRICAEIYRYTPSGNIFNVGHCAQSLANRNRYLSNYTTNKGTLFNAFLALPALLMGDKQQFRIQTRSCETSNEIRYIINNILENGQHYTKDYRLDLLTATRYTIQDYEMAEGAIKSQSSDNLRQTPKHVIRVYNVAEKKEKVDYKKTVVVSNRENALLLIDSILQFISRCVLYQEITISENCKQQLDNIYDVVKAYKGIVYINDEELWQKITPYVFEIYNEIIPFDKAQSLIEQGRFKSELKTFQNNRIVFYANEIVKAKNDIANHESIILNAYENVRKIQHTKHYLEEQSDKSIDNIINTLKNNKSVQLLSIENKNTSSTLNMFQINIKINTLLTNIDYALVEKSIIRSKSTGMSHDLRYASSQTTKLWYNLLMNGPKYALKVTQDFRLKIRPSGVIDIELINCNAYGDSYQSAIEKKQAIPNPHLHYYNCLGTTTTVLAKYSNIDETFEQYINTLIGCTANLNINDTTVFKKIIEMFNTIMDSSLNTITKLKLIVNLETGEEFSLYEFTQTEDFKNAPDNYKEFV